MVGAALPFCGECGARMPARAPEPAQPASVECPSCNATVPTSQRFCGSCGFAVGSSRTPGTPAVEPAPPSSRRSAVERPPVPVVVAPPPASAAAGLAPAVTLGSPHPRGTVPAPPPSSSSTAVRTCIACAAPLDALARTCPACGAFQVQLAPNAPEVVVPPPPSSLAVPSQGPASVPPPPAFKARPALEPVSVVDIPPLPRVPADLIAPPIAVPRSAPWRVVHLQNDGTEKPTATFEATVEIGRKATAALADDPFASPRHARLTIAEGGVRVEDLGSLNGVFRRIAPQTPVPLASGDVLLLGAQVLRFELLEGATLPGVVQDDTNVFGGPAKPRLARLVEVTCDGAPRSSYVIGSETVLIGREATDIVYADDPHLSRRHAEIRVVGGHAAVVDLASSNGTYVRVRGEAVVESGAQLRVGQQRLRVERVENRGGA